MLFELLQLVLSYLIITDKGGPMESEKEVLKQCLIEIAMGLQSDGANLEVYDREEQDKLQVKISGESKGCRLMKTSIQNSVQNYLERAGLDSGAIDFLN